MKEIIAVVSAAFVALVVLLGVVVAADNYFSPFERCVRAMTPEMKTEADAIYVCAALLNKK